MAPSAACRHWVISASQHCSQSGPGRLCCYVCKAARRSHDQSDGTASCYQTLWPLPGVPEYLHKVCVCVCVLKMNSALVVIIDVCVSLLLQLWCYDNNSAAFPPITPLSPQTHMHAVLSKYLRFNLFEQVLWHMIDVDVNSKIIVSEVVMGEYY